MSQHKFHTQHNGKPVVVQLGYDRPLDYFHMIVFEVGDSDSLLYSNLDEEDAFGRSLNDFRGVLCELGISVPESMFEQAEQDGIHRRGNRNVLHRADGSFAETKG